MRVLIVGATGNVGGCILQQLLALPSPPTLRASSRNPSKLAFPATVEAVQGDLQDPSTYPVLFASVDRVFFCAPYSSTPIPQLMAALRTAGVQRVVFLSTKVGASNPRAVVHS